MKLLSCSKLFFVSLYHLPKNLAVQILWKICETMRTNAIFPFIFTSMEYSIFLCSHVTSAFCHGMFANQMSEQKQTTFVVNEQIFARFPIATTRMFTPSYFTKLKWFQTTWKLVWTSCDLKKCRLATVSQFVICTIQIY